MFFSMVFILISLSRHFYRKLLLLNQFLSVFEKAGSKLLIRELPSIFDGSARLNALPQDDSKVTLAPKVMLVMVMLRKRQSQTIFLLLLAQHKSDHTTLCPMGGHEQNCIQYKKGQSDTLENMSLELHKPHIDLLLASIFLTKHVYENPPRCVGTLQAFTRNTK